MSANTPSDAAPDRPVSVETEAELDELVRENDLVLVEFYTEGCGICQSIEPVLGNVARAHEDLTVVLVNPRDDPPLIDRFDVRSVPMLVLFEDGERVGTLAEGFQGGSAIDDFVAETRSDAV
jgi:thioredoxin-like negative regulator of GroEL